MNRTQRRASKKAFDAEQEKWPDTMTQVPKENWPRHGSGVIQVWRSRRFLAVFYSEAGSVRISINRTSRENGRWAEGISWEDIQEIKRQVGMGDRWAVECFPPDKCVINVSPMRHIWLLPEPPPYGWK